MSELVITAIKRTPGERKVSRKALRDGKIPAVYYAKKKNFSMMIDRQQFEKHMNVLKPNTIFSLEVDKEKYKVFVRDYSVFLSNQRVQHIDFLGILPGQPFTVKVPLRQVGLSKGVVRGGVMRKFVSAVSVRCDENTIPKEIEVDVSGLDVGDYIYISDLAAQNEKIDFLEAPQKAVIAVVVSRATTAEDALSDEEEVAGDGAEEKVEEKE